MNHALSLATGSSPQSSLPGGVGGLLVGLLWLPWTLDPFELGGWVDRGLGTALWLATQQA